MLRKLFALFEMARDCCMHACISGKINYVRPAASKCFRKQLSVLYNFCFSIMHFHTELTNTAKYYFQNNIDTTMHTVWRITELKLISSLLKIINAKSRTVIQIIYRSVLDHMTFILNMLFFYFIFYTILSSSVKCKCFSYIGRKIQFKFNRLWGQEQRFGFGEFNMSNLIRNQRVFGPVYL